MSMQESADIHTNDAYAQVNWKPPKNRKGGDDHKKAANLALRAAISIARDFQKKFKLKNEQREKSIPMFESQELVLGKVVRKCSNFFTYTHLRGIQISSQLKHGAFGRVEEEQRQRFVERSIDGYFCVKFLQNGIYNSVHAVTAAEEMMMETMILMNLTPHPNICQLYGVTAAGSEAYLNGGGRDGFFIIVDLLSETLNQRLASWRTEEMLYFQRERARRRQRHKQRKKERRQKQQSSQQRLSTSDEEEDNAVNAELSEQVMNRLEVALDICSALVFLADRDITFYIRPDKVGFDTRYGRVKLCDFGQAREHGQQADPDDNTSLTKTDDIRQLAYTAPEVLCQAPVTVVSDVYAFGVLLWEVLSLKIPFEGLTRGEHFEEVVMGGERPKIYQKWPKEIQALITGCWDANFRPKIKKVFDTLEESILFLDPASFINADDDVDTEDGSVMEEDGKSVNESVSFFDDLKSVGEDPPDDIGSVNDSNNDNDNETTANKTHKSKTSTSSGKSAKSKRSTGSGGKRSGRTSRREDRDRSPKDRSCERDQERPRDKSTDRDDDRSRDRDRSAERDDDRGRDRERTRDKDMNRSRDRESVRDSKSSSRKKSSKDKSERNLSPADTGSSWRRRLPERNVSNCSLPAPSSSIRSSKATTDKPSRRTSYVSAADKSVPVRSSSMRELMHAVAREEQGGDKDDKDGDESSQSQDVVEETQASKKKSKKKKKNPEDSYNNSSLQISFSDISINSTTKKSKKLPKKHYNKYFNGSYNSSSQLANHNSSQQISFSAAKNHNSISVMEGASSKLVDDENEGDDPVKKEIHARHSSYSEGFPSNSSSGKRGRSRGTAASNRSKSPGKSRDRTRSREKTTTDRSNSATRKSTRKSTT